MIIKLILFTKKGIKPDVLFNNYMAYDTYSFCCAKYLLLLLGPALKDVALFGQFV